ncbi:MAG: tetratricopeptide repeat protein [Ekhidna sp.]
MKIVAFRLALLLFGLLSHFSTPAQSEYSAKELNDLAWEIKADQIDSARTLAIQALKIGQENRDLAQEGRSEKILGILHWFQQDLDEALMRYENAFEIFQESNNLREMSNIYNNVGIVLSRQNRKDTALVVYQKALSLSFAQKDSAAIGRNYLNIAVLYSDLEESENAVRYLKLAAKFNPKNIGNIYSNIAGVHADLEDSDSAIFYYKLALSHANTDRHRARITLNMGPHFLKKGFSDSARIYLNRGIELLPDKSGNDYAKAIMDQAGLLTYEGKYEESLPKLMEALNVAEEISYTLIIPELQFEIAKAHASLKQWERAYDWRRAYEQMSDSLKNIESKKHLTTLQEQFEYEKNQRRIGQLTQANLEKEVALADERNTRNIILFFSVALLFIIGAIWILNRKNEERKRYLLEVKKMEIEQRMLRSQMNPHFIFNALNSIQSFITTNNTYEAEVFMSKFSMLVRKILENSTHKRISLEEEVETLQLYLELEKSRFEERFDFEIVEDADSTIPIPPMLLQPFIENAIIHGMKDKTEKGHIYVRFIEEENQLICEVEDDGVGRSDKASEATHKSLATSLTNDRISFFNQASNEGEFNLKIVDLQSEEGAPRGTKVIITIPLTV